MFGRKFKLNKFKSEKKLDLISIDSNAAESTLSNNIKIIITFDGNFDSFISYVFDGNFDE